MLKVLRTKVNQFWSVTKSFLSMENIIFFLPLRGNASFLPACIPARNRVLSWIKFDLYSCLPKGVAILQLPPDQNWAKFWQRKIRPNWEFCWCHFWHILSPYRIHMRHDVHNLVRQTAKISHYFYEFGEFWALAEAAKSKWAFYVSLHSVFCYYFSDNYALW